MKRTRHPFGALIVAAALSACSESITPEPADFIDARYEIVVEQNIVYAGGAVRAPEPGKRQLLLDLYRPSTFGVPAVRPGVVLVHGGGFSGGSKISEPIPDLARRLAELGYGWCPSSTV